MPNLVLLDTIDAGIAAVTLNCTERRNALSIDLLERLCAVIESLSNDPTQRIVILRGAGPVFSSGLDLREAADSAFAERSAAAVSRTLKLLQSAPLVVVAAVQGGAFAGGAGVMAACDIIVAADNAKIGFPEVRRGLLPALISEVLRHKVREGDLLELFLAGEPINAARAQQIGLVQRVVRHEALFDEALAVARSVIAGGPEAVRQTKALVRAMFSPAENTSHSNLIDSHLATRITAEAREGFAAFAEKRPPRWQ